MSPARRFPVLLPLLALLVAPAGPATADPAGESRFVAEPPSGGHAVAVFAAAPLVTMTPTPFTLALADDVGLPASPGELDCELTMPAMPMPENRPRVAWDGERYQGEAIFTMAGAWRLTCRSRPAAGDPVTLVFDLPEVRLK